MSETLFLWQKPEAVYIGHWFHLSFEHCTLQRASSADFFLKFQITHHASTFQASHCLTFVMKSLPPPGTNFSCLYKLWGIPAPMVLITSS